LKQVTRLVQNIQNVVMQELHCQIVI